MRESDVPFFRLAMDYSEEWASHFRRRELTEDALAAYEAESRRSVAARETIEREDSVSFDQYLKQYYDQYRAL
jgi:glutamate--cysteine ligase